MPAAAGPVGRLFAWLGAAAFALALLVFAYVYLIRFGRVPDLQVAPSTVAQPLLVNLALFGLFALHHSVFARPAIKGHVEQWMPRPLERTCYVWVASLLFALTCLAWRDVPGLVYELPGGWRVLGWIVQASGLAVTIAAVRTIDALELAGVRQARGETTDGALEVRGPYGVLRHPLYAGWALIVFGAPMMTATRLSFAVISTLYLMAAIPLEERTLERTFGEAYRQYRRRVRWRMLPGVY